MDAGRRDIEKAAEQLARRLPEPLAPLARVAYNYQWTWLPGGPEAFRSIDPRRWRLNLSRTKIIFRHWRTHNRVLNSKP